MKLLGYNITKNMVKPPDEIKKGQFTYTPWPTRIVDADISNYKNAIIAAKGRYIQERTIIYDIYQNALDFDSHMKAIIERRLLATTGRRLEYYVNDEPSEQAKEVINSPRFQRFMEELLMVKFWGFGLFEVKEGKWFDYETIPIKHIDPYEKVVRKLQYSTSKEDQSFEDVSNVVFVGHGDDFGLMQQLSLIAMYKRAALGDWAQYSQLAGTNFRVAKFRGTLPNPSERKKIIEIINNAGSGTLQLPDDIDVETSNQTSSSQNQLFENWVGYLDDQMTKLVLGQTMTTEDGSSRSQAEVHERTQQDIFDADSQYILNLLNFSFYEILLKFGLPAGGKWEFVQIDNQLDMIEQDLRLKELINIDPAYLYEKYGVPMPEAINSGNLAAALGVGGLQALQGILIDQNLDEKQKINILTIVFGLSIEDASKIVTKEPVL